MVGVGEGVGVGVWVWVEGLDGGEVVGRLWRRVEGVEHSTGR